MNSSTAIVPAVIHLELCVSLEAKVLSLTSLTARTLEHSAVDIRYRDV